MKQVKDNNTLNEQLSEEHKYESENISKCRFILPYADGKGCTLVRSLQRQQKVLFQNIIYTSTKLLSYFNMKDEIPFAEKYDFVYWSVCATENCIEDYVRECARACKI